MNVPQKPNTYFQGSEKKLRNSLQFTVKEKRMISQPAFTSPKLTIETLEQGVNMFKVNNKDTSMVLVSLLLTLNM